MVLAGEKDSAVRKVLCEDLQRFAAEHSADYVAAEWQSRLGWTRFLWCRKEKKGK